MAAVLDQAGADLLGVEEHAELGVQLDVLVAHLGPAADRHRRSCRRSPAAAAPTARRPVAEAAEGLGRQHVLGDAVEVVQHRHAAPADAHGRVHVGLGPVEDLAQLVPVADRLEVEVLDRRAGDDEPVEAALARLAERLVEGLEVRGRGVLRLVLGHADQRQLDLQRRRADDAGELGLGLHLLRHQVEEPDLQRADVLAQRRLLRHDHHALAPEHVVGGQGRGDLDRHAAGASARGECV